MRKFKTLLMAITTVAALSSCSKDDNNSKQGEKKPDSELKGEGKISLQFENYVGDKKLVLGTGPANAEAYTSNGQTLKFSEVKYVITNVVLVKADGTKVPYHTEDLDKPRKCCFFKPCP